MKSLLSAMRITLHVLFAFLLAIALFSSAPMHVWQYGIVAFLAAVYVAGTVVHHRGKKIAPLYSWIWLALILGTWAVLVSIAADFVWLLFPLVFVVCYLITWPYSLLVVAASLVVTTLSTQTVLGPAIGTAAAVVGYRFYLALSRELLIQTETIAQLHATRDELATTSQRAGRLAEREHLAREIHDTLAQGFSSIILLAQAAQKTSNPSTHLTEIENAARSNLDHAREFLQAPSAGLVSPAKAIEDMVATHRTRLATMGEKTIITTSLDDDLLPGPLSTTVTRVAQEAVNNALKHADASQIVVTLEMWNDRLHLDVVDDGRGFNPETASGFGLTGLRQRLEEVGGTLHVESQPGEGGTTLSAQIPL